MNVKKFIKERVSPIVISAFLGFGAVAVPVIASAANVKASTTKAGVSDSNNRVVKLEPGIEKMIRFLQEAVGKKINGPITAKVLEGVGTIGNNFNGKSIEVKITKKGLNQGIMEIPKLRGLSFKGDIGLSDLYGVNIPDSVHSIDIMDNSKFIKMDSIFQGNPLIALKVINCLNAKGSISAYRNWRTKAHECMQIPCMVDFTKTKFEEILKEIPIKFSKETESFVQAALNNKGELTAYNFISSINIQKDRIKGFTTAKTDKAIKEIRDTDTMAGPISICIDSKVYNNPDTLLKKGLLNKTSKNFLAVGYTGFSLEDVFSEASIDKWEGYRLETLDADGGIWNIDGMRLDQIQNVNEKLRIINKFVDDNGANKYNVSLLVALLPFYGSFINDNCIYYGVKRNSEKVTKIMADEAVYDLKQFLDIKANVDKNMNITFKVDGENVSTAGFSPKNNVDITPYLKRYAEFSNPSFIAEGRFQKTIVEKPSTVIVAKLQETWVVE